MVATLVGVLFIIVCLLLIVIILLQRGRGGGLSGAFGGAGAHTAFGTKTGDVFTWITVGFTVLFILLAVVLNYLFVPQRYKVLSEGQGKARPLTTAPYEGPTQDDSAGKDGAAEE